MKAGYHNFINDYDPMTLLTAFLDICKSFNAPNRFRIVNILKKYYIIYIKYPLFRRKVKNLEEHTIKYILKHPDILMLILSRYFVFFGTYCQLFKLEFENILDTLFNKDEFALSVETEELKEGILLKSYNMVIRSILPKDIDILFNNDNDMYLITRLEADLEKKRFNLSQTIYDTTSLEGIKTAKVLSQKDFLLGDDGKLYNPNYALNRDILDLDLVHYRYMISHILGCILDIYDTMLAVKFVKIKT